MGGNSSKQKLTQKSSKSSSSSGSAGKYLGQKSADLTNTSEYQEYLKMVN